MAESFNFRSALGGFNREDVVRYLEHINAKHQNQINQLTCELEELRSQAQEDQSELVTALQEENIALAQELMAARAALKELQEKAPEEAPAPAEDPILDVTPELETYRRAERIEREARERSELIYFQANSVIKEAGARLDNAMTDLTEVTDQVLSQLTQLQVAASNGKIALQDAAAVLNTIRPNR